MSGNEKKVNMRGCKALKTLTFWQPHFLLDSKMIADTKAVLFVLVLASEWFAGLLSHPILYWERKRLCWLSVKEGRQSLLLFFGVFFEVGKKQVTQFLQPHHDLLRRVWSKKPWTHSISLYRDTNCHPLRGSGIVRSLISFRCLMLGMEWSHWAVGAASAASRLAAWRCPPDQSPCRWCG